jgi:hypothetical protein
MDFTNRHLELYDQVNATSVIAGTNLKTKLKVPAVIWSNEVPITNIAVFNTIKGTVKFMKDGHMLYYKQPNNELVELGWVELDMETIHHLQRIAKTYIPSFTEIIEGGLERLVDDDMLIDRIELGKEPEVI